MRIPGHFDNNTDGFDRGPQGLDQSDHGLNKSPFLEQIPLKKLIQSESLLLESC